MIADDSLACRQRQPERGRCKPVSVHYGGQCILANGFIPKEDGGVENKNQVHDFAAEPGHVADHHELVGVLD